MENNIYNNSCIYKISKENFIYIGSTCNYNQRMRQHKSICNNINSKSYNLKIYQTIRLNGGWDEFEKVVIQNVCCENRKELHEIEGEFIKKIGTINCMIAGRSQKKYYEDNRDKIKEYRENNKDKAKQYYENNKDKIKEYRENNKDKIKKYYENNKDKLAENRKQYYENNKDKIKEYRENNKDKLAEYKKQYCENNKDKIKEYYENNKDKIKQYYENNKERISEQQKQKIICPICGVFTRKYTIKRHQKTKKCLQFQ